MILTVSGPTVNPISHIVSLSMSIYVYLCQSISQWAHSQPNELHRQSIYVYLCQSISQWAHSQPNQPHRQSIYVYLCLSMSVYQSVSPQSTQ